MSQKGLLVRLLYLARDLRSHAQYDTIRRYCRGRVLDVGGWDFVETAIRRKIPFEHWTTLEPDSSRLLELHDPRVTTVHGDGCAMELPDASFDTVLNIQVLEHVFEPIRMVREIARVLNPGGYAVLLVPQTSTMHLAPTFYGNFSRFWIRRAIENAQLELVELRPLGGVWSSAASHAFFFFLQAFRVDGMSDPAIRRGPMFYFLFPLQVVWAVLTILVCLVLSLGDLREEPNNHLVVARRRGA